MPVVLQSREYESVEPTSSSFSPIKSSAELNTLSTAVQRSSDRVVSSSAAICVLHQPESTSRLVSLTYLEQGTCDHFATRSELHVGSCPTAKQLPSRRVVSLRDTILPPALRHDSTTVVLSSELAGAGGPTPIAHPAHIPSTWQPAGYFLRVPDDVFLDVILRLPLASVATPGAMVRLSGCEGKGHFDHLQYYACRPHSSARPTSGRQKRPDSDLSTSSPPPLALATSFLR